MKKISIVLIISLLFVCTLYLTGCRRYVMAVDPPQCKVSKDSYSIEIKPLASSRRNYDSFTLIIENKTKDDIDLIWDRTFFIHNGQTNGGFMFEGIIYADRNNSKPPDVIFAENTYTKTIYPNNLVSNYKGWYHNEFTEGEYGVYITLMVKGKEIREKLSTKLSYK